MRVLAIDPGCTRAALVGLEGPGALPVVLAKLLAPNEEVLEALGKLAPEYDALAVEWIESYGMPVGREVFETCRWVGQFAERWLCESGGNRLAYVTRREVKLALCNSVRARDSNVRAALLDLYGGRAKGLGSKRAPGPLYGLRADLWSALAVGLVWMRS